MSESDWKAHKHVMDSAPISVSEAASVGHMLRLLRSDVSEGSNAL